jgi:hypothetical protein
MPKADERPADPKHDVTPGVVDEDEPQQPPPEEDCAGFAVQRATESAKRAAMGDEVRGVPRPPDLVVVSQSGGALGFAPPDVAQQLLTLLQRRSRTATLRGKVTRSGAEPEVHICVFD